SFSTSLRGSRIPPAVSLRRYFMNNMKMAVKTRYYSGGTNENSPDVPFYCRLPGPGADCRVGFCAPFLYRGIRCMECDCADRNRHKSRVDEPPCALLHRCRNRPRQDDSLGFRVGK